MCFYQEVIYHPKPIALLLTLLVAFVGFFSTIHPARGADEALEFFAQSPKKNWTASTVATDSSGETSQGVAPGFNYDADLYENIDYGEPSASSADIREMRTGLDRDYLYVRFEFVSTWTATLSQVVTIGIEIDIDHPTESNRGDFFASLNMKAAFNTGNAENWIDASTSGGYSLLSDENNDVGGSNPVAPDLAGGDGYETNFPQQSDTLWARVTREGHFEVAIQRSAISAEEIDLLRSRVWSKQSGVFSANSFTFHDNFAPAEIISIDNFPGAQIDFWTPGIDPGEDIVDLEIIQTVDNPLPKEDETVILTTTLSHLTGIDATGVFIETLIPPGLTFISALPSQGTYDENSGDWQVGDIDSGAQAALEIMVSVDIGQRGNSITVQSVLSVLDQFDINTINNVGATIINVAGHDGSIEFVADLDGNPIGTVIPGDTLFVKVIDEDLNLDDGVIELATATILSEGFDSQVITLNETAIDSAVFTGSIATEIADEAIINDGILQLRPTDTIIAEYLDLLDSTFDKNVLRRDTLIFTAPQLVLTKLADKTTALPTEEITYQIRYQNIGASPATSLVIQELIPNYTSYVTDSMKAGLVTDTYAGATSLTDADDGNETIINNADVGGFFTGTSIQISISTVAADDNVVDTGEDTGSVFFKVSVD
jgi:uncharacterized repeat protein (TIGR01451 family)